MKKFTKKSNKWWDTIIQEALTKGLPEIAEREGLTIQAISYQLKKRGIDRPVKYNRVHNLNEDFFEVIDTEEKAYWLGFIMADGCVTRSSKLYNQANRLSFNLSAIDRPHLEKFVKAINSSAKITDITPKGTYSNNPISRLSINSVKMCNDLAKYGIVERKTGYEHLPNLPNELMNHFIRGFFDGDGHATTTRKTVPVIGFSSNESMLFELKSFLYHVVGLKGNPSILKDKSIFKLSYSGMEDVIKLWDYLYGNATLYLERKYLRLYQLLSSVG
jgi:hypothetical protein